MVTSTDSSKSQAVSPTRLGFAPSEWVRLSGFYGVIAALHVLGWGFFLLYAHDFGRVYAGAGALAYTFGLRHAFDADHISAVDDTTRFLMQKGKRPLGVGFFFSLGHSTIVFSLAIGVAVAAQAVQRHLNTFQNVGGLIGATVSGTFLWIVGLFNLVVLIGIVKVYRELKRGLYRKDELEDLLLQRGFMNRLLGSRFRRFVNESWHMYPVGVLFGLGFDTASEVGLLAITATAATTSTAHHGAVHIPFLGIIALPILFTAGMSLMDTTDGVFMTKAYGWAFTSPLRKVYYNITTTALSVFVALGVGTIEYLQVASAKLNVQNGFFSWLNRLNFESLGYWIVGSFVLAWLASIAIFKVRRVEERWGGMVSD
ncbi:MAG TPA: HoxN/HupN/NixA family nickel/cobalt transporter [Actinomycetota bacterium]|nr:HoxN/HupN/NixA family nickel/cobalt transporter [Actinomycetota bacterium]